MGSGTGKPEATSPVVLRLVKFHNRPSGARAGRAVRPRVFVDLLSHIPPTTTQEPPPEERGPNALFVGSRAVGARVWSECPTPPANREGRPTTTRATGCDSVHADTRAPSLVAVALGFPQ